MSKLDLSIVIPLFNEDKNRENYLRVAPTVDGRFV